MWKSKLNKPLPPELALSLSWCFVTAVETLRQYDSRDRNCLVVKELKVDYHGDGGDAGRELLMMVRKVVDMECWVGGEAESGRGSVLV